MRIDKYKKAKFIMKEIDKNPSNYLVIHYSCESFYDIKDGKTPRITSIAIRYYDTGQTDIFSIHKVAEKKHIYVKEIDNNFDVLEKEMLKEYFDFIKQHKTKRFLHWNMRDINYGFKAIEHRYEVLGGRPFNLPDENKLDISRILIDFYGINYISHPRLTKLMEKNKIKAKDFLSGEDEANAFENKEYIKLHQSTLRKVDVLCNIIERCCNGTLKTNSKLTDTFGLSPQGLFEIIKNNWVAQTILWIVTLIAGALIGKFIS